MKFCENFFELKLNSRNSEGISSIIVNSQLSIELKGVEHLINLTGLNNKKLYLNADHIEKIEEVPETLITLTNGKKYIVLESIDEVVNKVIEYKRKIFTLGL